MTGRIRDPIVSIIMPTYNRAAYLLESIGSVLAQTYTEWELIIVDDGSTDNSEEVVAAFNDARIQFYKAGRIGINGRIKNIGLSKATGELIAFLDSDDLWAPIKLEQQVELLSGDTGFCLVGGYNFKEAGVPLDYFYKKNNALKKGDLFLLFFSSELAAFTQALMFRKECLQKTGLFKENKAFSDAEFVVSLAFHFKGVILYEPLVFRRLHDDNHSNSNWKKSYQEAADLIHDYKNFLPGDVYESALFRVYMNFGGSYLERELRTQAMFEFLRAWRYRPLSIRPLKKIAKAGLSFFK